VAARKQAVRKTAAARKKTASKKKAGADKRTAGKKPAARSASGKQTAAKQAAPRQAAAKKPAAKTTARKKTARKTTSKAAALRKPTRLGNSALLEEIEALAKLMEEHALIDVSFAVDASGTKEIHVSRGGIPGIAHGALAQPVAAPVLAQTPASDANEDAPEQKFEESLHAFVSPMVGTFYRAPSPESPAFVSVGDHVEPTGPVCIIEAMKVMNEITPDVGGDIVSIEVENGEAVEFGQTLMLIRLR
jgi:acetyl-CoA carboxylase biotin carboxyl carrier protein